MQKINFTHTDESGAAHEALRQKLKDDMERFEQQGGVTEVVPFGVSADRDGRIVTGIANSDASRQVAARTNRKHGGRLTQKHRDVMQALQELSAIPGMRLTRQGLKNRMHLQFNILNDRLKLLANKGYLKVNGDDIVLTGSV